MKHFYFSLQCFCVVLAGLFLNSCGGDDDDPEPLVQPKPEITIPGGQDSNLSVADDGGTVTLKFTSATDWTLKSDADWVSVGITAGEGGSQDITLTIQPNPTPDERAAILTIRSGEVTKTIKIIQKQKDSLTLSANEYEIGAAGGEFSVEVKSNIDFDIQIADKHWLHAVTARALSAYTLRFKVDANESTDERNNEIVIASGDLKETIKVRQEGKEPEPPVLKASQTDFSIATSGGNIAFDVESNIEYTIELDADWISRDTGQSTTGHLAFIAAPNTSAEKRTTKIILKGEGIIETVTVEQEGKPKDPTTGGTEDFKEEQEDW